MRITSSMMLAVMLREKKATTNNMTMNNNVNTSCYNNKMLQQQQQHRLMVGRANNRSGVHGTHLPATDTTLRNGEVEKEINKGTKKKEEERKNVEKFVDSHLSNSDQQQPNSPTK